MTPDRWLTLRVMSPSPEIEGLLAEGLVTLGGRAVVEEGGEMITHLEPPPDPEAFVSDLRRRLVELTGTSDLRIKWEWQAQENWEEIWKRGLGPRRVTPRLVVAPSWTDPGLKEGEILIEIDPGMAFGTAEHETTRGCLRLLDGVVRPGARLADVGSGSGILSIAAAKLGAAHVLAVESDPLAIEPAQENVRRNGVDQVVSVVERLATPEWLSESGPFDGIVSNIEGPALVPLLSGFSQALSPSGWLILGGILANERAEVLDAATRSGLVLHDADTEGQWWSAHFERS